MSQDRIQEAAQILRNGGLVAFPTETVYGLGADASNELAVRKVFQAKGRPTDHPLIIHLSSPNEIDRWAKSVPETAYKLAQAFWPGPLTLVLHKQPKVLACVTGGQNTVALRMPRHPEALALLRAFGGGLVAPSANRFTRISPTSASAVREELGDKVDMIIDGGACEVGLESTILDLTGETPVILRPGMIAADAIAKILGRPVSMSRQDAPVTRVPGMHHVHYAPSTATRIMTAAEIATHIQNLQENDLPIVCMVYSNITFPMVQNVFWVRMPADAVHYAHELYRTMRSLDQQHYRAIIIESVPEETAWEAIRDRLSRASN
jgi:L-threonylcarbamoyladenylate synthase